MSVTKLVIIDDTGKLEFKVSNVGQAILQPHIPEGWTIEERTCNTVTELEAWLALPNYLQSSHFTGEAK